MGLAFSYLTYLYIVSVECVVTHLFTDDIVSDQYVLLNTLFRTPQIPHTHFILLHSTDHAYTVFILRPVFSHWNVAFHVGSYRGSLNVG